MASSVSQRSSGTDEEIQREDRFLGAGMICNENEAFESVLQVEKGIPIFIRDLLYLPFLVFSSS